MPNPVVHFEIPANNTARAKKFYEKTFGWKIVPQPGHDYFSVVPNGKFQGKDVGINGGMMKRDMPGQPLTFYISVDSVDAALKLAVRNGAKIIMPKRPIADMGAIALFLDPEGNVIGLHEMVQHHVKRAIAATKSKAKKKR